MKISPNSIVVATESQVCTALGAETVILHFNKGAYFGLNEVGTAIWEELQQPQTVRQIYDAVLAEYDVEPETFQQDVLGILD